jgi:hypothetical protein
VAGPVAVAAGSEPQTLPDGCGAGASRYQRGPTPEGPGRQTLGGRPVLTQAFASHGGGRSLSPLSGGLTGGERG